MKKSVKIWLIAGGSALVLGLVALFWYLAMTNNKELIARIPKDAAMVFKADIKSLAEKAEFKQWKDLAMFDEIEKESEAFNKALEEPKHSGVNFMQNAYGFVGKSDEPYGGINFGIKDPKDFEKTVATMDDKVEIQKTDGLYTAELDKGDVALVWDKDVALLYFKNADNVMEKAKQIFSQDEDMSMLENDSYMDYESLDADLGTYLNMKKCKDLVSEMSGVNKDQFQSMDKVEGIGMTVLFEDNQMLVDATYYPVEGATEEEISMMKDEELSADLVKLISPTQPKGFYAANMNLDKILGIYPQLNTEMQKEGFSLDEIKNGLTGEMSVALMDVKNMETEIEVPDYSNYDPYSAYGYPMKKEIVNRLTPIVKMNFGVKDRGMIESVISRFVSKVNERDMERNRERMDQYRYDSIPYDMVQEPRAKRYQYNSLEVLELEGVKLFFKYEGNYLSISNSESAFSSQSFKWDEDTEEMLSEMPGAGFMDLNYRSYPDFERENARDFQEARSFLEMFNNMRFSSDGLTMHFEMNFTESEDHILWRMMKTIDAKFVENKNRY